MADLVQNKSDCNISVFNMLVQSVNHTPEFWELIGTILPDYERRKEWLETNGKFLYILSSYSHHTNSNSSPIREFYGNL